jgi:hypothetical protein
MYLDQSGSMKAFNKDGALFFNLRYFVQCHTNDPDLALSSWYMTFCHELAHNVERGHNRAHGALVEILAEEHLRWLKPA